MTTINEKLGLKPRTTARKATHARALQTDRSCPNCGSHHVIGTESANGRLAGAYMCGSCTHFFNESETP